MATNPKNLSVEGEKFAQFARSGIPFNPIGEIAISGKNLERLQKHMKVFKMNDPRFVTAEQARANFWGVLPDAQAVQLQIRDESNGLVQTVAMINAEKVVGIPALEMMIGMSDEAIATMRALGNSDTGLELENEFAISPAQSLRLKGRGDRFEQLASRWDQGDSLSDDSSYKQIENSYRALIGEKSDSIPRTSAARHVQADLRALSTITDKDLRHFAAATMGHIARDQKNYQTELAAQAPAVAVETAIADDQNYRRFFGNKRAGAEPTRTGSASNALDEPPMPLAATVSLDKSWVDQDTAAMKDRFAVQAPYWKDGLHNFEGIALAREINRTITQLALSEDGEAIAKLLAAQNNAMRLGLEVVHENHYLNDRSLKANIAEPRSLLNGALVRDRDGAYRPAAGGPAQIIDKGDSLALKGKNTDLYRAAMELALAKGWTVIELKGKPAMLAEAWLEAKMLGLDVINYVPNEKDMKKYAERVALEARAKSATESAQGLGDMPEPETVEVRPYTDPNGLAKTATVTYTVTPETGKRPVKPETSQGSLVDAAATQHPGTVRAVTRAEGAVQDNVVAGVNMSAESAIHAAIEPVLDREVESAIADSTLAPSKQTASLGAIQFVEIVGRHVGPIMSEKDGMISQRVGRGKLVWHDLAKIEGSAPKIGESADIVYANGVGTIQGHAVGQEKGASLGR